MLPGCTQDNKPQCLPLATPVAAQLKLTSFASTCDHGQTTVDYHCIYFAYIHLYRVQVATNVQLNYNYEIFKCDILIINSSYFHIVIVP